MRAGAAALVAAAVLAAGCGEKRPPGGPVAATPDAGAPVVVDDEEAEAARTAAIEQAMNDLAPVAHQCWAAAAVDDYRLAGEVALLVDVDAAGAVTATVHQDTTGDAVLTDCLVAVAEAYAWAPPMRGHAALLPLAFTAPRGQNVIDRRLVPEVATPAQGGARVLLDAANTGNAAASIFELHVAAGEALPATASQRAEVWYFLHETAADSIPTAHAGDAVYLPPGAVRAVKAPAEFPIGIVVITVPGGDETGSRRAAVLPASPASLRDKGRPKPIPAPATGATAVPRAGMGTVTLLVEPGRKGMKDVPLAVSRLDIEAGAAIPAHVHDGSTELLYVLSGSGTMTVDGVELPVGPTSVIQIPAGIEHAFTAAEAMQAIQIYTPAGPEQRFKSPPK